jgi:plasmid stabilization system protein ParE
MQKFEILILDEANEDLEDIFAYIAYELKVPDIALTYYLGLLDKIFSLKNSASLFAPNTREFLIRRYGAGVYTANYKKMVIVYNIDGDTVVIRRVMPASLVL